MKERNFQENKKKRKKKNKKIKILFTYNRIDQNSKQFKRNKNVFSDEKDKEFIYVLKFKSIHPLNK